MREDPRQLRDAGLDIDGHLGELHAARRHRRQARLPVAIDGDRLRPDLLARLGPRHASRRVVPDVNAAARGDERRRVDAERRRDLLLQRVERLDRRDANRRTDARGRRAATRHRADAVERVADLRL